MADVANPAIGPSLPSAALPASGSRGLQFHTGLSAIAAPPQYCFCLRIELASAKSIGTRKADVRCQRVEDNTFHLITNLTRLYPAGDVDGAVTFESV